MLELLFHKNCTHKYENSGLESQPVAAWDPVLDQASCIGADISFSGEIVHIEYGRSHGDFPLAGGGAQYALQFLKECAG